MTSQKTAEGAAFPSRLGAALALLALLALAAPIVSHVRIASDPQWISDDVRIWVAALAVPPRDGSPADVPHEYLRSISPIGWRLLYETAAAIVDPEPLSRVLPYPLLALTLAGLYAAARAIGGAGAGWAALAFALSTPLLLERVTGGLARGFAFPLLAVGLAALALDRPRALAAAAILASWFYPAAGAILLLALMMLVGWPGARISPAAARDSPRRRAALVVVAAALASAPHVPTLLDDRWGAPVGAGAWALYPEAGPGGRYGATDLARFAEGPREAWRALAAAAEGGRPGLLAAAGADSGLAVPAATAALLVLAAAACRPTAARRALLFLPASVAGYALAAAIYPRLSPPQRYFGFSFPLLLIALAAAGPAVWSKQRPRSVTLASGLAPVCFLALFGWGFAGTEGYIVRIPDRSLFRYLDTVDDTALVAGFPRGQIENVPLRCRRRALLTFETHQVFHEGYVLDMRARAEAVFEALFGDEPAALARLRDRFGVDFLLVDTAQFEAPPGYFEPFDAAIERIWRRGRQRGFAARAALDEATVHRDGRFALLDLARLPPRTGAP